MIDQVGEIKSKVDIVSIIGEHIELKKAGRNYKACCPFHSEKSPSFIVSPELQIYKCFGCAESGDVISFLEKYDGLEFREALKVLADKVGIKLVAVNPGEETERERIFEINQIVAKFYHYILTAHPGGKIALDYLLKDRGIKPSTIEAFQIGFSPDVPNALTSFLVGKKKYTYKDLDIAGLTINISGRSLDKFRGRVIFPLYDHRGQIAGFAGRILPNEKNKELAKYINSPETPTYHKSRMLYGLNMVKEEIKKAGQVIIVEGEMDMIPLWEAGIKNVVAIKGTALTEEQIKLISRFTKKVIFSLDADFAGDAAAQRGVILAQKEGLEIRVARLKGYKDPGEAVKDNPEFYKQIILDAIGIWDFIIENIFNKHEGSGGEEKAKISREIVPMLALIPDKIVQAHYVELVASKLGVSSAAVGEQLGQFKEVGSSSVEKVSEVLLVPKLDKTRRQLLEERLLALLFQLRPERITKKETSKLLTTPLASRIVSEFEKYYEVNKSFSLAEFAQSLPKELVEGFSEMVLVDVVGEGESEEDKVKEISLVERELSILELRRKLEELGAKIRVSEESEEKEKLSQLQIEFGELSLLLSKLEQDKTQGIILSENNHD